MSGLVLYALAAVVDMIVCVAGPADRCRWIAGLLRLELCWSLSSSLAPEREIVLTEAGAREFGSDRPGVWRRPGFAGRAPYDGSAESAVLGWPESEARAAVGDAAGMGPGSLS